MIAPDLAQAEQFLQAIDPQADAWTFQTADDHYEKRGYLAKPLHGPLSQHAAALERLQAKGAGVFVTINETDGKGRKTENIIRVRAVYADYDVADPARFDSLELPLQPSVIVESSPGKHHVYWLVDDLALKQFQPLQKRIIELLGTDGQVNDLPRPMRLPGFWHQKTSKENPEPQPFQTRLVELDTNRLYTAAELLEAFPAVPASEPPERAQTPPRVTDDRYAQAALERAIGAVASKLIGERNAELNRQAFGLYGLAKAGRLNEAEVTDVLERAAASTGLAEGEITATLDSARGKARPRYENLPDAWVRPPAAAAAPAPSHPDGHPLARVLPDEPLRPPAWLLPGFLAEGITLIAGGHGVGKTTALLPLAAGVAGMHRNDWPLAPKRWRHVVYITEDPDQAMRIIHGLADDLGITAAVIRERLHLVAAYRLPADRIVTVGEIYRERFTRTVDKVELLPLVVLDTQAATVELENENDNSEASQAVAAFKQRFEGLPLWIVAHLAKMDMSRKDAQGMSARGAGAWGADANTTAFLIREGQGSDATRWLALGKWRFEPRWPELVLESHCKTVQANDAWGDPELLTLRWAIATPPQVSRAELAAQARELEREQSAASLAEEIIRAVEQASDKREPLSRSAVRAKVGRNRGAVYAMIDSLLAENKLYEVEVPSNLRLNPAKKAYLIALSDDERAALADGKEPPAARLEVPASWRKPLVPDGDERTTENGDSGDAK